MPAYEVIGKLFGAEVLINRKAKTVFLAGDPPTEFSIDHPYIQGTKLEREARKLLESK